MPPRKKKKRLSSQTKIGLSIDGSESIRLKSTLEEHGYLPAATLGEILGISSSCENQRQDKPCKVRGLKWLLMHFMIYKVMNS